MSQHHLIEADDDEVVVRASDGLFLVPFSVCDRDRDLPSDGDTVTLVIGEEVVRGTVVESGFYVRPNPRAEP